MIGIGGGKGMRSRDVEKQGCRVSAEEKVFVSFVKKIEGIGSKIAVLS